jgi:hypothetical protein
MINLRPFVEAKHISEDIEVVLFIDHVIISEYRQLHLYTSNNQIFDEAIPIELFN